MAGLVRAAARCSDRVEPFRGCQIDDDWLGVEMRVVVIGLVQRRVDQVAPEYQAA